MLIKESSNFWKAEVTGRTPRCPWVEFRLLTFFSPVWTVITVLWMKNDFTLCVSEPSCAVHNFVSGVSASVGLFSMTSILESVKLLKRESVHGSGLDFFCHLCLFYFCLFCWYVSNCIFTHSCIFSVSVIVHVNYYFTISELKQCQWRPAVVTWYILSACPLMFTWTWRFWADSSLCSENAWRRGFPLLALALPRCLVMLSRLTLLMLLAASKGNKWF